MSRSSWTGLALSAVIVVGALSIAPGQDRDHRKEFMREKLGHSKDILDGLTGQDFDQIAKAARALQAMREVGTWAAPSRFEAERYKTYSLEFQELTGELIAKAKRQDLDGATLVYLRLTVNCVNCHKELRPSRR